MEFGSWDPNLSAMANLSYVGTHLKDGKPDNDTACVTNFDQAGFVMGTSASLFNVCRVPLYLSPSADSTA
jgi:lysophospholipase